MCLHFWLCYSLSINCQLICHHAIQNKAQTPYFAITIFLLSHLLDVPVISGCPFPAQGVIQSYYPGSSAQRGRLWYVLMLFHLLPGITLLLHQLPNKYLFTFQDETQENSSLWNHSWFLFYLPTLYTVQSFIRLICSHVFFPYKILNS